MNIHEFFEFLCIWQILSPKVPASMDITDIKHYKHTRHRTGSRKQGHWEVSNLESGRKIERRQEAGP